MKFKEEFGFFVSDFGLKIGQYIVKPVNGHATVVQSLVKQQHPDDKCFYPIEKKYKGSFRPGESTEAVPNTERQANLYRLPPTHIISTESGKALPDDFRQKEGAFIIQLLAVLYRGRAQFSEWSFDTPLPLRQDGIAVFNNSELEKVMNVALATFTTWKGDAQTLFINTLFMHARCSYAYFWLWERFIMEYIVTDSMWKIFTISKPQAKNIGHGDRINCLIDNFGLFYERNEINRIVSLRNGLFHEGLWDKASPGYGESDLAVRALFNLQKLNQRLILAFAGLNSDFIRSDWRSLDSCLLL